MKAVEVCYWSCKFRKRCKDWHTALLEQPGIEAVSLQLTAASKKSGRVFDPQTMILMAGKKNTGKPNPATLPF
ncbi:MAG: hypothetical protein SF339_11840 [Blastocatellia bacterium]|nr:hypothetical protein [Blastocatellia bacterium]